MAAGLFARTIVNGGGISVVLVIWSRAEEVQINRVSFSGKRVTVASVCALMRKCIVCVWALLEALHSWKRRPLPRAVSAALVIAC